MDKFKEIKTFKDEKRGVIRNPQDTVRFIDSSGIKESFKNKILSNDPITMEDIRKFKKDSKEFKIPILGDKLTLEEVNNLSKKDIDISKKILSGELG